MDHAEVSKILLDKMENVEADWRKAGLRESLQTIWGAAHHSSVGGMKALAEQIGLLAKKAFPAPFMHISAIARLGDTLALRAATETLALDWSMWGCANEDPRTGLNMSMLDQGIEGGCVDMVQILIDLKSKFGRTSDCLWSYASAEALHEVASCGHAGQFRALKAAKNLEKREMVNALMTACEHQRLEMAHAIWASADFDLAASLDAEQKTKLAVLGGEAAAVGHIDFLQLIIEAGAPLDHVPERTKMPLMHRAAIMGQVEVIEALAQAGAKVDAKALALAVLEGQRHAAEALIRHGADPNGSWGGIAIYSPAGQAIAADRDDMLQFLASHGVDVATEEYLELAIEWGAESCIALIEKLMSKKWF